VGIDIPEHRELVTEGICEKLSAAELDGEVEVGENYPTQSSRMKLSETSKKDVMVWR
jgi:hypothetical protein